MPNWYSYGRDCYANYLIDILIDLIIIQITLGPDSVALNSFMGLADVVTPDCPPSWMAQFCNMVDARNFLIFNMTAIFGFFEYNLTFYTVFKLFNLT